MAGKLYRLTGCGFFDFGLRIADWGLFRSGIVSILDFGLRTGDCFDLGLSRFWILDFGLVCFSPRDPQRVTRNRRPAAISIRQETSDQQPEAKVPHIFWIWRVAATSSLNLRSACIIFCWYSSHPFSLSFSRILRFFMIAIK